MPLIDSPRLTDADRLNWARFEHFDDVLSKSPRLEKMADRARRTIEEFVATGPCICSTSWGKDSTVVAHLFATSEAATRAPLVFARARHWETPEVDQVRDVFLAAHPHVRYEEREYVFRVPLRGEPGEGTIMQDAFAEVLPGRYISGIRGEESKIRAISLATRGETTRNTCRPIGRWKAVEVFAYLHGHDLPVHPAYAMTGGGAWDRTKLRVHALGCAPRVNRTGGIADWSRHGGLDLLTWELLYYADVIEAARRARVADGTAASFPTEGEWS